MSSTPVPPPPAVNRQRLRWLVPPTVAFALVAGFGLGPGLVGTGAAAAPILPDISAQDLVAKVVSATPPSFSGTIQTKTNLGLPSLGSLGGNSGLLTTLLTPHTLMVSAAPGGKFHVAIPDGLTETDFISDGTQVWVWQSSTQTVTHLVHGVGDAHGTGPDATDPMATEPTPDAIARKLLADADPTTRVFVRGTASVANHDAYELVLAPKASTTKVADVVIDVDATTSLPLRVQVLAMDSGTPAVDVGFTKLDYGAQPDSAFTFTPPPGSSVIMATSPSELLLGPNPTHVIGPDGQPPQRVKRAPDGTKTPVAQAPVPGQAPPNAKTPVPGNVGQAPPDAKTQVLGTGWETVLALPNGPALLRGIGTPVSGTWGSGHLVTSTLADALVLDNGTVLVGMVGPDRLEAAVAELHP
jgi:outer membrane lipoprotein-sorting protein